MSSKQDRQALDLLGEALDLPAAERLPYIQGICSGDPDLLSQVKSLLARAEALPDDYLANPAATELCATDQIEVGPYRIIETLGEGGMGTVYLAEQREPVQRLVALKVISTIHLRGQRRRFEAEGQTLARLAHPNVAAMYDVGSTKQGNPYLAMELVQGSTITDWCDERRLGIGARLELFLGVCAGVGHAHEKAILHRDIKPANVLVTEIDGHPVAKVIDFGIARALDVQSNPTGTATTLHGVVGSPAYLSPEAAADERIDIDTRSDVHALGVLLYELLVGVRPFDDQGLGIPSLLRCIAEQDPPGPSARFAGLPLKQQQAVAKNRKLEVTPLRRRLRGDLDAILHKATARERKRRYASPAELTADLLRYLNRQPILARPPSIPYFLGRFVQRNKGAVIALVLLVISLASGVVARTMEARRANLEADRAKAALSEAREVSQFLVDLFKIADPERAPGSAVSARELLDLAAKKLRGGLEDQPHARARFMHTLADIYTNLGLFDPAAELETEALAIRRAVLPADDVEVIESISYLGTIRRRQERLEEAEPLLERALELSRGVAEIEPLTLATALSNLGNLRWNQKRRDEAEKLHRQSLEIRERVLGSKHIEVAMSCNNLGVMLMDGRRYNEAAAMLERAAATFEAVLGDNHPRLGAALNNLGMVKRRSFRWNEIEAVHRRAATIWETSYGPDHPRTIIARTNLANLLVFLEKDLDEAVRLRRNNLAVLKRTLGDDHAKVGRALYYLANVLMEQGDLDTAERSYQRAFAIQRATLGAENARTMSTKSGLAGLARLQGRLTAAEHGFAEVLEYRVRTFGDDHTATARTRHKLGLVLVDQGRDDEAQQLLERSLAIRRAKYGDQSSAVADSLYQLALIAWRKGQPTQVRQLLSEALDIRRQILPPGHSILRETAAALAALEASESAR